MTGRVAVVTGANKGIGLAITRALCQNLGENGVVYLTARDEGRGMAALEVLKQEGLSPRFHILDVTRTDQIQALRDHLVATYGGLDILVNNAGILTAQGETSCNDVNFLGILEVCNILLPHVRSGGRVVNVSSSASNLFFKMELNDGLKKRFREASTQQDVIELINECRNIELKDNEILSWDVDGYNVSKLGVAAVTSVLARNISAESRNVIINSCCPGFVETDLTAYVDRYLYGGRGKLPVEEGADTPVYLAMLPPDTKEPHGQFLLRREVYDFINKDVTMVTSPE